MAQREGPNQKAAREIQRLIDADGMTGDIFDTRSLTFERQLTPAEKQVIERMKSRYKNWFLSWYREPLQRLVDANKSKSKYKK